MQPTYIRFETPVVNPDSGVRGGVFFVAYDMRARGELTEQQRALLNELLAWFKENLKIPTKFNSSTSKGAYRRTTRGISWFKLAAQEPIGKIRVLSELLRELDVEVNQVMTTKPGYIVYEDEFQIVAEPFSDGRRR